MRTIRIFAAIATLTALSAGVGPASAGPPGLCDGTFFNSPDGRIKLNDRQGWAGTDQFPVETKATPETAPGTQVTFTLRWKNITLAPHTIRVRNPYLSGDTDIRFSFSVDGVGVAWPDQLYYKDLVFNNVAPGQSTPPLMIVMKKKLNGTNPTHSFMEIPVRGRYGGADTADCDGLIARMN